MELIDSEACNSHNHLWAVSCLFTIFSCDCFLYDACFSDEVIGQVLNIMKSQSVPYTAIYTALRPSRVSPSLIQKRLYMFAAVFHIWPPPSIFLFLHRRQRLSLWRPVWVGGARCCRPEENTGRGAENGRSSGGSRRGLDRTHPSSLRWSLSWKTQIRKQSQRPAQLYHFIFVTINMIFLFIWTLNELKLFFPKAVFCLTVNNTKQTVVEESSEHRTKSEFFPSHEWN